MINLLKIKLFLFTNIQRHVIVIITDVALLLFPEQEWEEKRRQNIEKMNEEMERIAEYERGQRV